MKSIVLDKVIPIPLHDNILNKDSVWGKECTIDAGDQCLVCAPSGTGKTTLVSSIYGLRTDYTGTVKFDNENTQSFSLAKWALIRQQFLSVVFQDLLLFPQLTAFENILIKHRLQPIKTEEEIKDMVKRLGIGDKLGKKCGLLSLGQQQRVAIVRALVQPFSFLLMDEPFSHIDENNIQLASALIQEECSKNKAALVITSLSRNSYFPYTSSISV